jgi:hypothetical protein
MGLSASQQFVKQGAERVDIAGYSEQLAAELVPDWRGLA